MTQIDLMTQITIKTSTRSVIIYDQAGEAHEIGPGTEEVLQLPDDGFCTISDPDKPGEDFVERMVEFWQKIRDKIEEEVDELPKPKPV